MLMEESVIIVHEEKIYDVVHDDIGS